MEYSIILAGAGLRRASYVTANTRDGGPAVGGDITSHPSNYANHPPGAASGKTNPGTTPPPLLGWTDVAQVGVCPGSDPAGELQHDPRSHSTRADLSIHPSAWAPFACLHWGSRAAPGTSLAWKGPEWARQSSMVAVGHLDRAPLVGLSITPASPPPERDSPPRGTYSVGTARYRTGTKCWARYTHPAAAHFSSPDSSHLVRARRGPTIGNINKRFGAVFDGYLSRCLTFSHPSALLYCPGSRGWNLPCRAGKLTPSDGPLRSLMRARLACLLLHALLPSPQRFPPPLVLWEDGVPPSALLARLTAPLLRARSRAPMNGAPDAPDALLLKRGLCERAASVAVYPLLANWPSI